MKFLISILRKAPFACYLNKSSNVIVLVNSETFWGIFLYPDNYNGKIVSSSMSWAEINAAGIVCLPAAGCRGSNVDLVGLNGSYWSSTALHGDFAYYVHFHSSDVSPVFDGYRSRGNSVRLITECQ